MSRSDTPDRVGFGARLKLAREGRGMTQLELARVMGVSQATISQWQSGGAVPDRFVDVFKLEQVLELPPGYLSHVLGFLPLGESTQCTVQVAVAADPFLDATGRDSILAIYEMFVRKGGELRAE